MLNSFLGEKINYFELVITTSFIRGYYEHVQSSPLIILNYILPSCFTYVIYRSGSVVCFKFRYHSLHYMLYTWLSVVL